ncbi:uncharacterized, partial [Tachysurus ichikawai]
GRRRGVCMSSNSDRAQAPGGRRLKYGDPQRKGWIVTMAKVTWLVSSVTVRPA